MSRYFRAKITENRPLNENHYLLALSAPDSIIEPAPGQFYMLQVSEGYDPLLKRAFSLFRRTGKNLQFLYRIKGRGTNLLKSMKEGTTIDLMGPLGNGYPMPSGNQIPLIIAGGIGIASVFSLAEKLSRNAFLFYGAKIERELFMTDELKGLYRELVICTDDGSCGMRGSVVDVLDQFFRKKAAGVMKPVIYSCGPYPMLREIAARAAAQSVKAYVSLEENMACGIGACLGCVVRSKQGYKRVCKDGPVFEAGDIEW